MRFLLSYDEALQTYRIDDELVGIPAYTSSSFCARPGIGLKIIGFQRIPQSG